MEDNTDDVKYIALICNGIFNSIPDITIGELFENFCEDVNYNVISNEYGTFVDFTGNCLYNDQDSRLMIRFKVDYDKNIFGIIFVKLDDSLLDEEMSIMMLEAMAEQSDVEMIEEDEPWDDEYNDLLGFNGEDEEDDDDDDDDKQ